MHEATSPDADPASWDAKWTYHVPPPRRDYAQAAIDQAKAKYREKYKDADLSSLVWSVQKRER